MQPTVFPSSLDRMLLVNRNLLSPFAYTRPTTTSSKQPSLQPARPSYNPKLAPSPPAPSPPYLILQSWSTLPTFFGSSSSVVSVCTSHSQHVLVGAVALSTLLATTARHVLSQESYDAEEAPSKGQQHASAEKEGPESRWPQHPEPVVDDRRIEVVANGLPMWGGQPTSSRYNFGITAHQNRGAKVPGAALHDARRSKERTYPELLNNRRCRLAASGAMKLPTSSACSPLSPIQPSL